MNEPSIKKMATGSPITYQIEHCGEEIEVEVPFVAAVIGDFSGVPSDHRQPLRDRQFREISTENFEEIHAGWTSDPFLDLKQEEIRLLQGSRQGLFRLVEQAALYPGVRIEVLDITKAELAANLQTEFEIEQSQFFKHFYEYRYAQLAVHPFGLLLADYSFTHAWHDVNLLRQLARLGAMAMCPVMASAAPGLMYAERWEDLNQNHDLGPVFSSSAYLDWRALRETEEARHLVLTLPDIKVDGGKLCTSGVYATGAALIKTYSKTGGWNLDTALDDIGPAETLFSDKHRAELIQCGFLPVGQGDWPNKHLVSEARTLQRTRRYINDETSLTAKLHALLPCVLTVLHFGRIIKCINRDKVGSFTSETEFEGYLNSWIQNYVFDSNLPADKKLMSRCPLAEANIEVLSQPGISRESGTVTIVLHLRPRLPGIDFLTCVRYEMQNSGFGFHYDFS